MKICSKCKVEKELSEFCKNMACFDGKERQCRECRSLAYKVWREANKEKISAKKKIYEKKNKERIKAQRKAFRKANKEKIYAQQKIWLNANRHKREGYATAYYRANKERLRKQINAKHAEKVKNDSTYKLIRLLRGRTHVAIKAQYTTKSQSTLELLGGSVAFVKKWIESQFLPGMTWENHGEWHIDHIKPCASFDLTDPEQQRECFNYKNLQPLWAFDNLSKGDRF